MKSIIGDFKTLIASSIGLVGGGIWAYKSNWEIEPIVLFTVSFVHICAFLFTRLSTSDVLETPPAQSSGSQQVINHEKVKKQVNIRKNKGNIEM